MIQNSILSACEFLEKNKITYILINDFLGGTGNDVDLYIPKKEYKKVEELVDSGELFKRAHPSRHINHHYYYLKTESGIIELDVKFNLSFYDPDDNIYRKANFESEVIPNGYNNNIGYRPGWWHALLLYGAHCGFLERGKIEERHINNLKKYADNFLEEVTEGDQKAFANSVLQRINTHKNDIKHFPEELRILLRPYFAEISSNDQEIDLKQKKPIISDSINAYSVLFLGCDGTGKSTLVKSVKERILVPTNILYGGVGEAGFKKTSIYSIREKIKKFRFSGKLRLHKFWLLFIFPLELNLRFWRKKDFKKRKLILIDRLPDFSFKKNEWGIIKRLYKKILPKPDLVVLLTASDESLIKRKPNELSLEKVQKKKKLELLIADYCQNNGTKVIILKTDELTVEECSNRVIQEMWDKQKFKKTVFTQ